MQTMSIQERMGKEGRDVLAQQVASSQLAASVVQDVEPAQYFPALAPVHVFAPEKAAQVAGAEKKEESKERTETTASMMGNETENGLR